MKDDPLFFVIAAVMAGVVGILMFGIGSFGKGGEFSRKYSNKMMRWRIIAQFIAVMLILLFVWLRGKGA
ncbi:MAG: twin transmembrane helix small protein [Paracoccaceae bacterium]|nr:twin transmembrane helix small protein [Paracoccaceae bacterium]